MKPRLLDLFCGAGGAAMGYYRAGFEVVGVDHRPQPHFPFGFVQADALEYCATHGAEFDAIHASPPCQAYSEATPVWVRDSHPDLIVPTRIALIATGRPFVIENVENARSQLINPIKLCGSMFGLEIFRHRYFEVHPQIFMLTPPCRHNFAPVLMTGGGDGVRAKRRNRRPRSPVSDIRRASDCHWMTRDELTEAIPPAYTEFIGKQLLQAIGKIPC